MRTIFLLLLFVTLFSCRSSTIKPPGDLLDKKTMEKVLLDVNIAESYSGMVKDSVHRAGTKNTDSLALYYKDVFAHHKITAAQFTSSLNWYKAHPAELDTMYSNLIAPVQKWPVKAAVPLPAPTNVRVDKR